MDICSNSDSTEKYSTAIVRSTLPWILRTNAVTYTFTKHKPFTTTKKENKPEPDACDLTNKEKLPIIFWSIGGTFFAGTLVVAVCLLLHIQRYTFMSINLHIYDLSACILNSIYLILICENLLLLCWHFI